MFVRDSHMSATPAHALACTEIWGGNRRIEQDLALPGLRGWIHSTPLDGSSEGGDLYYVSLCSAGRLTRIGVADVSGHGQTVGEAAECLRSLLRRYIDTFNQTDLARELNRAFEQHCLGGKFATVVLLGVYGESGEMMLTNGGHPPPLLYRAAAREWSLLADNGAAPSDVLDDLPLGLLDGVRYRQMTTTLAPGDRLLVYSDALSEARNAAGTLLEPQGLLELAHPLPVGSPAATGQVLLAAVSAYRQGRPVGDDETLLVLQRDSA